MEKEEESNPVKDILYEIIDEITENIIQKNIAGGKSIQIINEIISKGHPKIIKLEGDKDENIAKFSTSLLHYLFTISLIPSQRKISYQNIDIDIVIPDLRMLSAKPENSLIICIPELHKPKSVQNQIQELETIHPCNSNIWMVMENECDVDKKSYAVSDKTISKIIQDVNQFLSSKKTTPFKIFRV